MSSFIFSRFGGRHPARSGPYDRWRRTLKRLTIRYLKPYVARHTSVSWNLMVGRNPLWVAKQHGNRIATMLSVYAAWTEDAAEEDIAASREAMNQADPRLPPPAPPRTGCQVAQAGALSLSVADDAQPAPDVKSPKEDQCGGTENRPSHAIARAACSSLP
jgi:hypothetical protein